MPKGIRKVPLPTRYCKVEGCGKKYRSNGYCIYHHGNWHRRGDPLSVVGCGRTCTHGMTLTAEYVAWGSMKWRCYLKSRKDYNRYGGRGIRVCNRWLHSFENFYADMGPRPSEEHSLDRYPDKDGNYEPGNVRWATRQEQANNTSRNRVIDFKGTQMTLIQWARYLGRDRTTIAARLKSGFSVKDALYGPLKFSQAECYARKREARASTL